LLPRERRVGRAGRASGFTDLSQWRPDGLPPGVLAEPIISGTSFLTGAQRRQMLA